MSRRSRDDLEARRRELDRQIPTAVRVNPKAADRLIAERRLLMRRLNRSPEGANGTRVGG